MKHLYCVEFSAKDGKPELRRFLSVGTGMHDNRMHEMVAPMEGDEPQMWNMRAMPHRGDATPEGLFPSAKAAVAAVRSKITLELERLSQIDAVLTKLCE